MLLASACALAGCTGNKVAPVKMPPSVVEVALPVQAEVEDHQVFTARTQAPQNVQIKARVTGYLTKINFQDGAMVDEGQVLFEIDNRPYKASLDQAKGSLAKAKADVEFAKASLTKAQAFYDIGLDVRKQNPAAVSAQEIDRRLGARDEAVAQVQQAQAEVAQTEGQLETAQLNYDWCKVTSPFRGRVDRHMVDVGGLVSENTTVLTNVVSLDPIWAYFNVDQNSALAYKKFVEEGKVKSIRTGETPVTMALSEGSDFPYTGKIDFVANQLDPNTGSIQLRATFPNQDYGISAGLFARIKVPTSAKHKALLVLDRAIGTDQDRRYILVANDKNQVEYRAVDVGQLHDNGLREVLPTRQVQEPGPTGAMVNKDVVFLSPTDRVIINGLQRVRPGDTVEPRLVNMITMLPVPAEKK